MSVDAISVAVAFCAGIALGGAYAAALWASVRRVARARQPLLWLLGGSALRLALLLGGFYLVMDGRWERLVACFAGFLVVRVAATAWAGGGPAPGQGA